MIFKLIFDDKTEYAQARDMLHLLQSYEQEYIDFQEIKEVIELSDEEAKEIMLINVDWDEDDPDDMEREFSLYSQAVGDDFCVIGSSEWL
jgi:hypothetical protein